MPLYSDSNYYYSGGSSQLYSPYYPTSNYSMQLPSSASYTPYTSTYNRSFGSSYVVPLTAPRSPTYSAHSLSSRYQPKLTTITESSPLMGGSRHTSMMPLTRILSPKISGYSAHSSSSSLSTKYVAPRPIPINTADIDVSPARFRKDIAHEEKAATPPVAVPENEQNTEQEGASQRAARSTIKRDRAVVRLSTIRSRSKDRKEKASPTQNQNQNQNQNRFRDLPHEPEGKMGWRQKLADDLAIISAPVIRKSPGDLIRERYLIQVEDVDTVATDKPKDQAPASNPEQTLEEVVLELDPVDHSIRRLSIPNCPSFHDICEDISSDKIDDDLNAGELRRRASIIQEQEQELLNQLQNSASGTFQFIQLERQDSHDDVPEGKRKSRKSKRLRHRVTAIVEVENHPLPPIIQEKDEDVRSPKPKLTPPTPKFTVNVESMEEHHEVHKIFKLPKKRNLKPLEEKKLVLPEGFVEAKPKPKAPPGEKMKTNESNVVTAEVFKFDQADIEKTLLEEKNYALESPKPIIEQEETKKLKTLQSSMSLDANATKITTEKILEKSKSLEENQGIEKTPMKKLTKAAAIEKIPEELEKDANGFFTVASPKKRAPVATKPKEEIKKATQQEPAAVSSPNIKTKKPEPNNDEPSVATPKPIRKVIEKSESGVDFWSQIGTRETLYMDNRKKEIFDSLWAKEEEQAVQEEKSEEVPKVDKAEQVKDPKKEQDVQKGAAEKITKSAEKTEREVPVTVPAKSTTTTKAVVITQKPQTNSGKPATSLPVTPATHQTDRTAAAATATATAVTAASAVEPKIATGQAANKSPEPPPESRFAAPKPAAATKPINEKVIAAAVVTTAVVKTIEPTKPTTTATAVKLTEVKRDKLNVDLKAQSNDNKPSKLQSTPATATATATTQSPTKTTAATGAPINADQFMGVTPMKNAASPTKAALTNASSLGKLKEFRIETTTKMAEVPTAVAEANAATGIGSGNAAATDTGSGNNLSKFATVSNLAQCLRDVDADLEDYIPSSAENSDFSDDDDSSFDYSSADGCENLSASMKKRLRRQRRRKEKLAEKPKFDPKKKITIDPTNKCYVKDEAPRYPLVATPRPLWKREKIIYPANDDDDDNDDSDEESDSSEATGSTEGTDDSEECTTSEEYEDDTVPTNDSGNISSAATSKDNNASIIRMSTCSNDSGFEGGTAPSSPKKMLETSYTYSQFQKCGRFTAPATVIPRFKNYSVDDFHFLAVLGKGSFGKVLLAELRDTTYYYAVKCLKKDVVLEDDDVDSTLIERKVLALGTKHPYLCHLFCTFQTESHLFFVMEYLNGGDLMFHIQESGRFPEDRARFYGAEIISGLKFLHKKGIIYRDLKLDNVLLDYEGHVRIADFGMCKLQIYLDKTADSFCGTPDYMAPEIIKGEKYNQNVDWWSFGVLLYEMLIGQSPFSGCDEDELFWSICNEIPWFPVYISAEATSILKGLLEKDYTKRVGSQYSPAGDISEHIFFRPIDWNLLEKRQLEPPFKPQVKHPLDTQYFDRVFTKERVRLTPIDREILQSMDQKQFAGFTYTNPHITLD